MKRDAVAGVLLVNAIPHAVLGAAGKRGMTPIGGGDSSPRLNLLWSAMNLAGGAAIIATSGWPAAGQHEAERRLVTLSAGIFAMTAFGLVYESTAGRRRRNATS